MCEHQSSRAGVAMSVNPGHMKSLSNYLGLKKVGWHYLTAVTIKEGQSRTEGRCRDTPKDSLGNDTSPAGLSLVDS
jgi:hypothetical protein